MALSKTKLHRFMTQASSMKDDPDYPIFEAGINEGRQRRQREVLSFLEELYTGPSAPPRESHEAKAILTVAKELSTFMKATDDKQS